MSVCCPTRSVNAVWRLGMMSEKRFFYRKFFFMKKNFLVAIEWIRPLTKYFRVYTRPYLTFHVINAAADIYSKPACLFWKTALRNSSGKIIVIHPLHKGMPFLLEIKWAKSRTWKKSFCRLYRQDQVEFFLQNLGSDAAHALMNARTKNFPKVDIFVLTTPSDLVFFEVSD